MALVNSFAWQLERLGSLIDSNGRLVNKLKNPQYFEMATIATSLTGTRSVAHELFSLRSHHSSR